MRKIKKIEKRRKTVLFQNGSAGTDNSLRRQNIDEIIIKAGCAICPTKYPESALNGIAMIIVRKRNGALTTFMKAAALNLFNASIAVYGSDSRAECGGENKDSQRAFFNANALEKERENEM